MFDKLTPPIVSVKDQRGFTLLEVMIAIAILAITVTMLFSSQSQSLSLITESQFNTQAAMLSGVKIAELESGKEELFNNDGDFGENFRGYTWKLEVDTPSLEAFSFLDGMGDELKQVDVTIQWGGEKFSHTVRYYIYDAPPPPVGQGGQGGGG